MDPELSSNAITPTNSSSFFLNLPLDIVDLLLQYFPHYTLQSLALTSRLLSSLTAPYLHPTPKTFTKITLPRYCTASKDLCKDLEYPKNLLLEHARQQLEKTATFKDGRMKDPWNLEVTVYAHSLGPRQSSSLFITLTDTSLLSEPTATCSCAPDTSPTPDSPTYLFTLTSLRIRIISTKLPGPTRYKKHNPNNFLLPFRDALPALIRVLLPRSDSDNYALRFTPGIKGRDFRTSYQVLMEEEEATRVVALDHVDGLWFQPREVADVLRGVAGESGKFCRFLTDGSGVCDCLCEPRKEGVGKGWVREGCEGGCKRESISVIHRRREAGRERSGTLEHLPLKLDFSPYQRNFTRHEGVLLTSLHLEGLHLHYPIESGIQIFECLKQNRGRLTIRECKLRKWNAGHSQCGTRFSWIWILYEASCLSPVSGTLEYCELDNLEDVGVPGTYASSSAPLRFFKKRFLEGAEPEKEEWEKIEGPMKVQQMRRLRELMEIWDSWIPEKEEFLGSEHYLTGRRSHHVWNAVVRRWLKRYYDGEESVGEVVDT